MGKKFITVRGEKSSGEMGITLTHEHTLIDLRGVFRPLAEEQLGEKGFIKEPIILENRGELVYKCFLFEDNLYQDNIDVVTKELKKFKEAGGSTLVDVTLRNIGRNPDALEEISINCGLNIIMGCGYYISSSWDDSDKKKTEKQITKEIIDEFEFGVGKKKIKPGVIGEIGIIDINDPLEVKSLRAAAKAQKKIDCAMIVHPSIEVKIGHEILDILEEVGVNIEKIILAHCDHGANLFEDIDYYDSLAKRGVNLAYDGFGLEIMDPFGSFLPSDGQRIKLILQHIELGNTQKLLLSQDTWLKISLTKWGGWGYPHIINDIVPRMKKVGITDEHVHMMCVENPGRILSL